MWDSFGFEFVNFYFMPGLVLGCVYALGAVGITLTLGVLRFGNFAHGEMMMTTGYITWTFILIASTLFGVTLHPLIAGLPSVAIVVFLFLLVDKYAYKPLRQRSRVMLALSAFGMVLIVRSTVQVLWGANQLAFVKGVEQPNPWLRDFTQSLDMTLLVPNKYLWIFAGTLIIAMFLGYFLKYTRLGKAMRAVSDNPELARVTGINVEQVIRTLWIIGGLCAAFGGIFMVMFTQFLDSNLGFKMILPMFASAILGGMGRPFGALFGGLVIGLSEELVAYPWIGNTPLIDPGYKAGVAFFIMVIMLIVKPTGLFKGRSF